MGQTVYKSDVGYRSILLYLFQLNYNYKSAFVMSNTFQRTFQHLVDANTVLQSVIPPLPPLQRAPRQAPTSLPAPALSPPSTTDQEIMIDGCHFHFCQAILRNVNQLGYKTEYEAITTDPATCSQHLGETPHDAGSGTNF